jgi:hypothetical protein
VTPVRFGVGLFAINVTGGDVPPPGEGLDTVIAMVVPCPSIEAGNVTVREVDEL